MTNKATSIGSTVIVSLFVFLFTYTGIYKILHHDQFLMALLQSPVLRGKAGFTSGLLPIVELCTAGLLLFKNTRKAGMYLSFVLMLIFSGYVLYLLWFIPVLPCSCGGVLQSLSWRQHLMLNLFLAFLALFEILQFEMPGFKNKVVTG